MPCCLCAGVLQDGKASDPMHTACDMMSLNGIVRVAISMVKGVEIHFKDVPTDTALGAPASEASSAPAGTSATLMEFAVFSVVSWFKVSACTHTHSHAHIWRQPGRMHASISHVCL